MLSHIQCKACIARKRQASATVDPSDQQVKLVQQVKATGTMRVITKTGMSLDSRGLVWDASHNKAAK